MLALISPYCDLALKRALRFKKMEVVKSSQKLCPVFKNSVGLRSLKFSECDCFVRRKCIPMCDERVAWYSRCTLPVSVFKVYFV